jgi:hypothetical protein
MSVSKNKIIPSVNNITQHTFRVEAPSRTYGEMSFAAYNIENYGTNPIVVAAIPATGSTVAMMGIG